MKNSPPPASLEVVEDYADENAVKIITDSATIHIPLGDLVDFEAERARLKKELDAMESEIKRAEGKLSNEGIRKPCARRGCRSGKGKASRSNKEKARLH